jgi:hypothetical protein
MLLNSIAHDGSGFGFEAVQVFNGLGGEKDVVTHSGYIIARISGGHKCVS